MIKPAKTNAKICCQATDFGAHSNTDRRKFTEDGAQPAWRLTHQTDYVVANDILHFDDVYMFPWVASCLRYKEAMATNRMLQFAPSTETALIAQAKMYWSSQLFLLPPS